MNRTYDDVLAVDDETRAGLFTTTAQRIGSTPQNVEKDFWVCWTLDALFNGLPSGSPRLLFKGGTSLSKGYGLISRFSEDIDVTVFRDDLGSGASASDLAALSKSKRDAKLDAIRLACEKYIQGPMLGELNVIVAATAKRTGLAPDRFQVRPDLSDRQTLLLWYPSSTPNGDYVRPAVRIESGAKSALDPNSLRIIQPYVDEDAAGLDLGVPNVVTVRPERTFWDKVVILHGLRRWYDSKNELRGGSQRVSRHYYDIYRLMQSDVGNRAADDKALGADCVAHARMFFNRPAFDLASAAPPTFALRPLGEMVTALQRDYLAMAGMIFGPAPDLDRIVESVVNLENKLNGAETTSKPRAI